MPVEGRKLVDEVSGWLRVYDDGSVDRSWFGPSEVKFVVEPVSAHEHFIDGVAVRDLDPKSGPRVRVYMPEPRPDDDPNKKLPVILHFPGGGFCISEADWFMYYAFYSKLARLGRAIIVSVYLPHAPENRLPAAIDEGFSALLWLTSLAQSKAQEELITGRADFSRVFLMGDSSGANVVHEVGAKAGKTNLSPLKLVGSIPIHPGVVRAIRSRSELEMPRTQILTLEMVDKLLSLALPIGSTKDHPITCPMGPAAPALDGLELPPILYCVAEKDLMVDTQMEFYEALKKANKNVELLVSENVTHCFYLNKLGVDHDPEIKAQNCKMYDAIIDFIRRH